MRATRACPIWTFSSPCPAMTRTSNQVTNPWSTSGSPKDNSVSTITRSTPDAPAGEHPCQTHPAPYQGIHQPHEQKHRLPGAPVEKRSHPNPLLQAA
jgi:hypothetical protein